MNVFKSAVVGYTENWTTFVQVLDDFSDVLRLVGLGRSTVHQCREDGKVFHVLQLRRDQTAETVGAITITEEDAVSRERIETVFLTYMKEHQELFSYDWEAEDA